MLELEHLLIVTQQLNFLDNYQIDHQLFVPYIGYLKQFMSNISCSFSLSTVCLQRLTRSKDKYS